MKSTLMNFKITLLCKLYSDTNTFNKAEEILEQEPLKKQTCPPIQMAPQKPAAEAKNWKKKPLARLLKVDLSQGCSVIFPPLAHAHTHTHTTRGRLSDTSVHSIHSFVCQTHSYGCAPVLAGADVHALQINRPADVLTRAVERGTAGPLGCAVPITGNHQKPPGNSSKGT